MTGDKRCTAQRAPERLSSSYNTHHHILIRFSTKMRGPFHVNFPPSKMIARFNVIIYILPSPSKRIANTVSHASGPGAQQQHTTPYSKTSHKVMLLGRCMLNGSDRAPPYGKSSPRARLGVGSLFVAQHLRSENLAKPPSLWWRRRCIMFAQKTYIYMRTDQWRLLN